MDLTLPSLAVSLSFLVSGFAYALGRAFGEDFLKRFGAEEFLQAVVNSALLGAFALLVATAESISTDIAEGGLLNSSISSLANLSEVGQNLSLALTDFSHVLGYYSSVEVELGGVAVKPFSGLGSQSANLSFQLLFLSLFRIWSSFLQALLSLIELFFPSALAAGLFLRAFAPLRRAGGLILSLAFFLYFLFPYLLYFLLPSSEEMAEDLSEVWAFFDGPFQALPVSSLNDPESLAETLDDMAEADFVAQVSGLLDHSALLLGKLLLAFFVGMVSLLFSLLVSWETSQAFALEGLGVMVWI